MQVFRSAYLDRCKLPYKVPVNDNPLHPCLLLAKSFQNFMKNGQS